MSDAFAPFRRIFEFSGRSRRREYWLFVLLCTAVGIAAAVLDMQLGLGGSVVSQATQSAAEGYSVSFNVSGGVLTVLWTLVTFIPGLAVTGRRLHDTNRSAWWLLIVLVPLAGAIALFVFMCNDGTPGPNRFGPNPKGAAALPAYA